MELTPEQLARQAKRGDTEAFSQLVLQNEALLARTAMTIVRDADDAADAVQEAILSAWQNVEKLRQPKYFRTWLTRILIRECYTLCEERDKHRHGELAAALDAAEEPDRDAALDVRAALEELGENDRLLLGMYYADGLSVREIAKILELSESAVKQRLHRGRRHFRSAYTEQEEICHEG